MICMRRRWTGGVATVLVGIALGACTAGDQTPSPSSQSQPSQVAITSEGPMTVGQGDGIRPQIEENWNLGASDQCPPARQKPFEIRVQLAPDGTVTRLEPVGDLPQDACSVQARNSASRAIMLASPLKLPPGSTYSSLVLRFHPESTIP